MEFAPIDLEIEEDLSAWRLNVSGKAEGSAELLSGPTTSSGTTPTPTSARAAR